MKVPPVIKTKGLPKGSKNRPSSVKVDRSEKNTQIKTPQSSKTRGRKPSNRKKSYVEKIANKKAKKSTLKRNMPRSPTPENLRQNEKKKLYFGIHDQPFLV